MKPTLLIIIVATSVFSCKKEIEGCTNSKAKNYNSEAVVDDGTCAVKHEGVYFVKDSLYVQGVFTEYKEYQLTAKFLTTEDSISFNNMWGINRTLRATKTEFTSTIFEQPYDQSANVTGSGTFEIGKMTYETVYGDLRHVGIGIQD